MSSVAARAFAHHRDSLRRSLSLTASQQYYFYSTRSTRSSKKVEEIPQLITEKPSLAWSAFPEGVKKQKDELVWPKPREIPFQAKISNFVNLIGSVRIPVRFGTSSDGKDFATTVISVGSEGALNHMSIPVVFEGDMAHVVACHVKKNDLVFVSGQLSVDGVGLSLSDNLGKFHVVAENLNFVEKIDSRMVGKKEMIPNMTENLKAVEGTDDRMAGREATFPTLDDAVGLDIHGKSESDEIEVMVKRQTAGAVAEKVDKQAEEGAGDKKYFDDPLALWRDLLENPLRWYDYRGHKASGLVKNKFPDFKQKITGNSLWINCAPNWVLLELGKLEFEVKEMHSKEVPSDSGGSDVLKRLIADPEKWWDNRTNKKNPRYPDFKNKETGEGIWLSDIPTWALSKLPPVKLPESS